MCISYTVTDNKRVEEFRDNEKRERNVQKRRTENRSFSKIWAFPQQRCLFITQYLYQVRGEDSFRSRYENISSNPLFSFPTQ